MASSSGPEAGTRPLPALEVALEAVVGNRLGAGVYARWVRELGLAGDERVLEVGCGAGACSRHLVAALPNGRLTCVDIDARWLAIAGRRLAGATGRVELVCADIARWSRPEAFDVAVAHFVLHDLAPADCSAAVREIARSLAPGGRVFVREPLTHGMRREDLESALSAAGLRLAAEPRVASVPLMGPAISGVWIR